MRLRFSRVCALSLSLSRRRFLFRVCALCLCVGLSPVPRSPTYCASICYPNYYALLFASPLLCVFVCACYRAHLTLASFSRLLRACVCVAAGRRFAPRGPWHAQYSSTFSRGSLLSFFAWSALVTCVCCLRLLRACVWPSLLHGTFGNIFIGCWLSYFLITICARPRCLCAFSLRLCVIALKVNTLFGLSVY